MGFFVAYILTCADNCGTIYVTTIGRTKVYGEKMLNIAIVEDEKNAAEMLMSALKRFGDEKGEAVKCVHFTCVEAFLSDYKPQYDVVFFDIMLPGITGMAGAHKLREVDPYVPLVFITSMAQFAIEGYSVNAVGYIVKPFEYYDLKMYMERICRNIKYNDVSDYILITAGGGNRRIKIQDIYYIETRGHLLVYHTAEGEFSSYTKTMKELEVELESHGFYRSAVSHLVNITHVTSIIGSEVTINGESLPITRGKRNAFTEKVNEYMTRQAKTTGGG